MKIEIKNLKVAEFMSEETLCFSCTVYVNGKKALKAENQGHGGNTNITALDNESFNLINAYAKSLPPYVCDDFTLEYDLEILIDELVNKENENKKLKKWCKKQTVFTIPESKKGEYMIVKSPFTDEVKSYILNKYPTAEIVNLQFINS